MTASSRQPYVYDVCLLGHDGRSTSRDFAYALADYLETKCRPKLKVFFELRDVLPGQDVFSVTDAFEKSKFTVAVMCRAFIQNRLNNYIAKSAFVNMLETGRFIPLYVLDVRKQDINNIQELQKYNAIKGLPFGDAVLPNENPEALDKLRRALTAGISQPEQDDRNNEGQGDVSNEETISQPQEETAPPCEDVTGGQPPPLLLQWNECQQEGMETLEPRDGVRQTRDESSDGPHFNDDVRHQTVAGQPQPGPSSPGDNPSQDLPPRPFVHVGTGRDSVAARPAPLNPNFSEGNAAAPEDRGSSSPPVDLYSPVSPMPKTQSEVFQGQNREEREFEAMVEETAEGGQGQDAVEDGSGENSVQGWMGSLSSFLRDVAPAIWTCILYTENSTPQLFPAKNNAKNGHCKD